MKKASSIFSLFCGFAMLAVWVILLATGQVVELRTTPIEASFLLVAEFLTAIILILGGTGVLTRKPWGLRTEMVALGLLLYCAVYSIGVFGQGGNAPAAGFFVVITLLAAMFSSTFIIESTKGGAQ
ncbi:MAG: hypothetical protein ACM3H7_08725 [Acidobacteriaceae bacterium]